MKQPHNNDARDISKKITLSKNVLVFILGGFVTALIALLLEYKSGIFQPVDETNLPPTLSSLFITFTLFTLLILIKSSLQIIFRPYKYVREEFAMYACLTITLILTLLLLTIYTQFLPWHAPLVIYRAFMGGSYIPPTWTVEGVFLLFISAVLVFLFLKNNYKDWKGLKSINQFQAEQRGEQPTMLHQGGLEFRRNLLREPPLKIHIPTDYRTVTKQLEGAVATLTWHEQAKELIRLSTNSYQFDEGSWHDNEKCYVGQNIHTGELVFLRPFNDQLSKSKLKRLVDYVNKITSIKKKRVQRVIVATKYSVDSNFYQHSGIPFEFVSEEMLLNSLVDFKDYFAEINKRFLSTPLPDSKLTLKDVYVPSKFVVSVSNDDEKSWTFSTPPHTSIEEYLNEWLHDSSRKQIALLGEYGQGKSTASLAWAYHLIQNQGTLRRIPIIIELRGTSPRNLTPLPFLGAWAAKYNINPQSLMRLIAAGRVVLIFEGFDEMALVGNTETRLKHFKTLWEFAFPSSKIIITGRPNFFLDEEEMKAALGISKSIGNKPYCQAVRLSPFSPEAIKEALRSFPELTRNQIYDLVLKNNKFYELVSRPSLLHIVAELWQHENLHQQVENLTSAYVMELFIRHSYRRQGLKQHESPEFMALTNNEREYFMLGIASYMAAKQLPNQITNTQLDEAVNNLIEYMPESVSQKLDVISGETNKPLRSRVEEVEHGIDHVKTDVRTCGILVDDPANPGTFRFGHKSFMEYLFAHVLFESLLKKKDEKSASILKATGATVINLEVLPVSCEFLAELALKAFNDSNGETLSEKTRNFIVAKELLFLIFGNSLFSRLFLKRYLLIHFVMKSLVLNYFGLSFLLRIFPMIIFFATFSWIYIFHLRNMELDLNSRFFSIGVISFIPILFMFYTVVFGTYRRAVIDVGLNLWCDLCRSLDISDKTLRQVINTERLPYFKDESVYRVFGKKEDSEKGNFETSK